MSYIDAGYSLLIRGSIDEVELDPNPTTPLVHYRGRYLTTGIRKCATSRPHEPLTRVERSSRLRRACGAGA